MRKKKTVSGRLLELVRENLAGSGLDPSLAELARLLEIEGEGAKDKPGSLTAGWIEEWQTEDIAE